jgi:hypothetical protein
MSKTKAEIAQKWIAGHNHAIDGYPLEIVAVEIKITDKLVVLTRTRDRRIDPNRRALNLLWREKYDRSSLGRIFFDTPREALDVYIQRTKTKIAGHEREIFILEKQLSHARAMIALSEKLLPKKTGAQP